MSFSPSFFSLRPGEKLNRGFVRLLEVFARKVRRRPGDSEQELPEAIHQLRVLIKRFRALLWFVRPALPSTMKRRTRRKLRKASHLLAAQRDAMIIGKTLEKVSRKSPNLLMCPAAIPENPEGKDRKKLRRLRQEAMKVFLQVIQEIRSAARNNFSWPSPSDRLYKAFQAVKKTGKKALREKKDAAFHDWRKKTKRLLHLLELTQAAPTKRMEQTIRRTDRLQEKLGDYHDYAMTGMFLRNNPSAQLPRFFIRRSLHLLEKKKRHLQKKTRRLARSVKLH